MKTEKGWNLKSPTISKEIGMITSLEKRFFSFATLFTKRVLAVIQQKSVKMMIKNKDDFILVSTNFSKSRFLLFFCPGSHSFKKS